jgi:hypothetical protein
MSGFTSNITQIVGTVYVATSAGPIGFGALSSTYGVMQSCQMMYLLQGSSNGNPEINNFLNSLSVVAYTQNPNAATSNGTNSTSTSRLLAAISTQNQFLEINTPTLIIITAFTGAYLMILLFERFKTSLCSG